MKVKELRALIAELPGDMLVVSRGGDHSFSETTVVVDNAMRDGQELSEWDGASSNPIKVLAVGYY